MSDVLICILNRAVLNWLSRYVLLLLLIELPRLLFSTVYFVLYAYYTYCIISCKLLSRYGSGQQTHETGKCKQGFREEQLQDAVFFPSFITVRVCLFLRPVIGLAYCPSKLSDNWKIKIFDIKPKTFVRIWKMGRKIMHFLCAQSSRSLAWFWRTSWLFNWFNCSLAKVDTRMKTIRLLSATHWHLGIKAGFFSPDRQIQNQFIFSILHHFHQKAGGYKVMFPNYQAKCSLWKLEMPKTVRWDLTEGLKCHTKLSWRPTGRAVIPLQDRFTGRYRVSEADCVQER